ncbi:MAG: hypothetical protein ABEI53_03550, partial [Candidatus Magasanikbacteria bacterium]
MTGAAAYSGSGGTSTAPECDDGIDNDNDGRIDYDGTENYQDDTDCTDAKDDSESPGERTDLSKESWDLDATALFNQKSKPKESITAGDMAAGQTILFGSQVVAGKEGGDEEKPDKAVGPNMNIVREQYLTYNYKDGYYGNSTASTDVRLKDYDALSKPPYVRQDSTLKGGDAVEATGVPNNHPDSKQSCGNALKEGTENAVGCPEDMGLPDDDDISGTVSGRISKTYLDDDGPLHFEEADFSEQFNDDRLNIRDGVGGQTVDLNKDEGSPDYYVNGSSQTQIRNFSAFRSGTEKIGTVKSYSLKSSEKYQTAVNNGKTVDVCTSGGINSTCSGGLTEVCDSKTKDGSVDDWSLKDVTVDISSTTKEVEVTPNKPDIQKSRGTIDQTLTIKTHDPQNDPITTYKPSSCSDVVTGCKKIAGKDGMTDCSYKQKNFDHYENKQVSGHVPGYNSKKHSWYFRKFETSDELILDSDESKDGQISNSRNKL